MISELDGLNKTQLFYLESKLDKIPKQEKHIQKQELASKKRRVREHLYECRHCSEAKMKSIYDKYLDMMDEDFKSTCKAEKCPYRQYYIEQSMMESDNQTDIHKFAEIYFKNLSK